MDWNSPEVVSVAPLASDTIDLEEVRRLYWEEGLSIVAVAGRLGVNHKVISRIMRRNNIPGRSHREAQILAESSGRYSKLDIDPEEVRRLYWEEELSIQDVAERFGVNRWSISRIMVTHNIPRRLLSEAGPLRVKLGKYTKSRIDPEEVRRLYWEEGLSLFAIAERLGVVFQTIHYIMQRDNIPRRSSSEINALVWAKRLAGRDKISKLCSGCFEFRPVSEFGRLNTTYDGLNRYCKKCLQESRLGTTEKRYYGLRKRSYPPNASCELCGVGFNKHYGYHHFDDNSPSLGFWACRACDYLAEGLDEIERNPWKADIYHRLKKEIEEAEKDYVRPSPFKPPDGIYRLFLNGEQTHKWCPRCGTMLPVKEFHKRSNSRPNRHLDYICRECRMLTLLSNKKEHFIGLHKRPKSDHCELCGSNPEQLDYHHWDDGNPSKGVYVDSSNKCHDLAEAVDKIDSGSLLPEKYYKLKQEINKGG